MMRQKHADAEEKDALNSTLLRQASFDLQKDILRKIQKTVS